MNTNICTICMTTVDSSDSNATQCDNCAQAVKDLVGLMPPTDVVVQHESPCMYCYAMSNPNDTMERETENMMMCSGCIHFWSDQDQYIHEYDHDELPF